MNVVNGGAHAQNSLDFQEFMLVPAGAESFSEALRIGAESYHHLKKLLGERGLSTRVGDEGGFAPDLGSAYEACEAILEAAERAGHRDRVALALDPATSELHRDGAYRLERQGGTLDTAGMIDLWADLCDRFPIVSIEDGLGETDWEGWRDADRPPRRAASARRRRPVRHQRRLPPPRDRGASRQRDPRQGEPDRHAYRDARRDRARAPPRLSRSIISHRSGETEDATIADLAVATNAGRSRPARRRARTASRSTTSCCASRSSSAREAAVPRLGRVPAVARATASSLGRVLGHARRTKIVATIGPATRSPEMVAALIQAGMDGARLNMSHGTHEDHARTARARPRGRGGGRAGRSR